MRDKFFKELDKCKSRLEIYDLLNNCDLDTLLFYALQHEFFSLMTYEVPALINALKEKYEFVEKQFIERFGKMLEQTQKNLDPEYNQIVNDNFHELLSE